MGMMHVFRILAPLILALAAADGARAQVADVVVLGSDYFETTTGTFFNFGPPWGAVDFNGYPIGPGLTDTIVQRTSDVVINGSPGPLQITALSLESTSPVPGVGNIFVTLNPADLSMDTGQITISGSLSGGMFTSFFDVFFDVCLMPGAGGVGCAPGTSPIYKNSTPLLLQNSGASWSPDPPPGSIIVTGPVGDLAANVHTGLTSNESDFWPGVVVEMHPGGGGAHVVMPAGIPEPSTWAMILLGFAGLGFAGYRKMKSGATTLSAA
jgi:hypothetical protein